MEDLAFKAFCDLSIALFLQSCTMLLWSGLLFHLNNKVEHKYFMAGRSAMLQVTLDFLFIFSSRDDRTVSHVQWQCKRDLWESHLSQPTNFHQ